MEITYVGHSCFLIKFPGGFSVCFDPYKPGAVPGLADADVIADEVCCSHSHRDHCDYEAVGSPDIPYEGPEPEIEIIHSYHDEVEGAKRGRNNITVINMDGSKIVHMGDIGCSLTDEQLAKIRGCDVLMIPVGGYYTIDCNQAYVLCEKICPGIVIPMHYSGESYGYSEISGRGKFVELINESGDRTIVEGGSVYETSDGGDILLLMEPLRKI